MTRRRPAKPRAPASPAVSVADLQRRKVDLRKVEALAAHVLVAEGRPHAALSVTLVDDEAMAELHARYSKVEGPTDVLAFPLDDGDGPGPALLGEVVVSTDTAAREARARGLPFARELLLYVAHGTLHLLGHDDHEPRRRRRMHRRQAALLAAFLEAPAPKRGSARV